MTTRSSFATTNTDRRTVFVSTSVIFGGEERMTNKFAKRFGSKLSRMIVDIFLNDMQPMRKLLYRGNMTERDFFAFLDAKVKKSSRNDHRVDATALLEAFRLVIDDPLPEARELIERLSKSHFVHVVGNHVREEEERSPLVGSKGAFNKYARQKTLFSFETDDCEDGESFLNILASFPYNGRKAIYIVDKSSGVAHSELDIVPFTGVGETIKMINRL